MTQLNTIRIATRKSPLAQIQALQVAKAIKDHFPTLQTELLLCDSLGDREPTRDLASVTERGYFTRFVTQKLLDSAADIAVHSWKDLPTQYEPKTKIISTLKRADMRDLVLYRKEIFSSKPKLLQILSSAPRRSRNLSPFLPNALPWKVEQVQFSPVRGTIETRINKLRNGEAHALVVAKAAIDRLLAPDHPFDQSRDTLRNALTKLEFMVIPLSVSPPAAAQGAIAIEALADNQKIIDLFSHLTCQETFESVSAERHILENLGGGCEQAIGAARLKRTYGEIEIVKGLSSNGEIFDSARILRSNPLPRAKSPEAVWHESTSADLNLRERIDLPPTNFDNTLIFCSHSFAWPTNLQPASNSIVWSAGLKTWQSLATQGIWVHGSADGLGEHEDLQLQFICPHLENFVKLTHENASTSPLYKSIFTYRIPKQLLDRERLLQHSHFYWQSSEYFLQALQTAPELASRFHGCGPGRSFETIRAHIDHADQCAPYINREEFLAEVII